MAAFTIDYKPQFIKTDLGALQNRINQTQQEYDQSMAGLMTADDKFSEIPVSGTDVALKNEVLSGFQDKTKSILERYGGDYAAAAKDLARAVASTSKDEFFNLAAYKAQLAEEQRKLAARPGSIVIKDVNKIGLKDPVTGKYIGRDDIGYKVTTHEDIAKNVNTYFGGLAEQIRAGKLRTSPENAAMLERVTTKGITPDEMPVVADSVKNFIMQSEQGIDEGLAESLANNYTKNLVKGFEIKDEQNPIWNRNMQMEMARYSAGLELENYGKKKLIDAGMADQALDENLFAPEVSDMFESKSKLNESNTKINDAAKRMVEAKTYLSNYENRDKYKKEIDSLSGELADINKSLIVSTKDANRRDQIKNRLSELGKLYTPDVLGLGRKNANKALAESRKEFLDAEKEFATNSKMYSQLKSKGLSNSQARNIVLDKIKETSKGFNNYLWYTDDKIQDGAVKAFGSSEEIYEVAKNGARVKANFPLNEILAISGNKLEKVGPNFSNDAMVFQVKMKDGSTKKYSIPNTASSNLNLSVLTKSQKLLQDVYDGSQGIGIFAIEGYNNVRKYDSIDEVPNGATIVDVNYDGRSVKSSVKVKHGNSVVESSLDRVAKNTAKEMYKMMAATPSAQGQTIKW